MKKALLALLLAACGQEPIFIVAGGAEEKEFVQPLIDALNNEAGCQWISEGFGSEPLQKTLSFKMSTATIEKFNASRPEKSEAYAFYAIEAMTIVMPDRRVDDGWYQIQQTAFLHELGHAMGHIGHSEDENNWMYPRCNWQLKTEDAIKQFVAYLGGPDRICTEFQTKTFKGASDEK